MSKGDGRIETLNEFDSKDDELKDNERSDDESLDVEYDPTRSEFGRGLTYCLGLFLCHTERFFGVKGDEMFRNIMMEYWFNGSSDHLYEMAEEGYPEDIVAMVVELRRFAFSKRYNNDCTEDDIKKAKDMALAILMKIDKDVLKVPTLKGDFE
jgi:hypothetical protein